MLIAEVTSDAFLHSAISIFCGVAAFVASELTRRYAWGRRDGEVDAKATLLAEAFDEFKSAMGDALREIKSSAEAMRLEIKADFARVYDLMGKSHICFQEQIIGELRTQAKVNAERIAQLEAWRHEAEHQQTSRHWQGKDLPGK